MNIIAVSGNTTQDIQLKTTQSGKNYCKFRIAVARPYDREKTDFFTCVAWGKTAETMSKYITKGARINVVGSMQMNPYETQDGQKRVDYEINVTEFDFPPRATASGNTPSIAPTAPQTEIEPDFEDLPFPL